MQPGLHVQVPRGDHHLPLAEVVLDVGGGVVSLAETTADLTAEEARQVVTRIRQCVEIALVEIKRAYLGRAWVALGYESWDAMCAAEIGAVQLPRDERKEAAAELRAEGMSTRAIASATGSSEATVRRDLAGASDDAPQDAEIVDAEVIELPTKKITGTDGKNYTSASPSKEPPQKSVEAETRKLLRRIESLTFAVDDFVKGEELDELQLRALGAALGWESASLIKKVLEMLHDFRVDLHGPLTASIREFLA